MMVCQKLKSDTEGKSKQLSGTEGSQWWFPFFFSFASWHEYLMLKTVNERILKCGQSNVPKCASK